MEQLVQTLRASPCAEPKVVGKASFLKRLGKMLGICTGDQVPKHIATDQRTHPAIVGLRHHAPEPHCNEDLFRLARRSATWCSNVQFDGSSISRRRCSL